jgi:aminopeptidase N
VPSDWSKYDVTTNHFQQGGGLNLRGYAGYLMPLDDIDGNQQLGYRTNSGAAVNVELGFDRLWKKRASKLRNVLDYDLYLFADAGILQLDKLKSYDILNLVKSDAGIGTALSIKKFGPMQTIQPLTIRFDVPLFLSATPNSAPDFVQFRWVIGINKAF